MRYPQKRKEKKRESSRSPEEKHFLIHAMQREKTDRFFVIDQLCCRIVGTPDEADEKCGADLASSKINNVSLILHLSTMWMNEETQS